MKLKSEILLSFHQVYKHTKKIVTNFVKNTSKFFLGVALFRYYCISENF